MRKNTHQVHLEDLVISGDLDELNDKIEKLIEDPNLLNRTVKIDGSPAILVWSSFKDMPKNAVSLKSMAKPFTTEEEIEAKYKGDMAEKLKWGLKIAPHIPEGEAWQGDCLFLRNELVEQGDKYLFQANKIVYELDKTEHLKLAEFGIAFHTVYRENGTQSFRLNPETLNLPQEIFCLSPFITQQPPIDLDFLNTLYNELLDLENRLGNNYIEIIEDKTFSKILPMYANNQFADKREKNLTLDSFKKFTEDRLNLELERDLKKYKTEARQEKAREQYEESLEKMTKYLSDLTVKYILECINKAAEIKMLIWDAYKDMDYGYQTYLYSKHDGLVPTSVEGVSMSDQEGNIVKIVDRAKFSYANRSDEYVSFRGDLRESKEKICVCAFGRFNPPTKGHEKLVKTIEGISADDHRLYLSHSYNTGKKDKNGLERDPLSYEDKYELCKKAFGDVVYKSEARTWTEMLNELYHNGFTKIIYVCGDDRAEDGMVKVMKKYNGQEVKDQSKYYNFPGGIDNVSAGAREGQGVENISATLVRKAAHDNDFESFKQMVPENIADELYEKLKGLLTEAYLVENKNLTKIELNKPGLRDALDAYLKNMDPELEIPPFSEGPQQYTIAKNYKGLFYKKTNVLCFSAQDLDPDIQQKIIENPFVYNGVQYKIYGSKISLIGSGLKFNASFLTSVQECLYALALFGNDINKDLKEYIKNYIDIKEHNLEDVAKVLGSWRSQLKIIYENSNEFLDLVLNIFKDDNINNFRIAHSGFKMYDPNLIYSNSKIQNLLAGNDFIDKSDFYIVRKGQEELIEKLVDLKNDPEKYIELMVQNTNNILGVSLKKPKNEIYFDYDKPTLSSDFLTGEYQIREYKRRDKSTGPAKTINIFFKTIKNYDLVLNVRSNQSSGPSLSFEWSALRSGSVSDGKALKAIEKVYGKDLYVTIRERLIDSKNEKNEYAYIEAAKQFIRIVLDNFDEVVPLDGFIPKNKLQNLIRVYNISTGLSKPVDDLQQRECSPYLKVY